MTTQTIDTTQRIEAYLPEHLHANSVKVTELIPIEDPSTEFPSYRMPDVAWYVHAHVTTFEYGKDHTVPMAFTVGEKEGTLSHFTYIQW